MKQDLVQMVFSKIPQEKQWKFLTKSIDIEIIQMNMMFFGVYLLHIVYTDIRCMLT